PGWLAWNSVIWYQRGGRHFGGCVVIARLPSPHAGPALFVWTRGRRWRRSSCKRSGCCPAYATNTAMSWVRLLDGGAQTPRVGCPPSMIGLALSQNHTDDLLNRSECPPTKLGTVGDNYLIASNVGGGHRPARRQHFLRSLGRRGRGEHAQAEEREHVQYPTCLLTHYRPPPFGPRSRFGYRGRQIFIGAYVVASAARRVFGAL